MEFIGVGLALAFALPAIPPIIVGVYYMLKDTFEYVRYYILSWCGQQPEEKPILMLGEEYEDSYW